MSEERNDPNTHSVNEAKTSANVGRRKLLAAGAGLSVLASLPGRPVLGASLHNCAPSGFASINLNMSDRLTGACGGMTPDSWRQTLASSPDHPAQTTKFREVFGANADGFGGDATLADVVNEGSGAALEFAVAYLNATDGGLGFTLQPSEVLGLYAAYAGGGDYATGSGVTLLNADIVPFLTQTHTYIGVV